MSEMALSKAEGSNQADGVNAYLVAIYPPNHVGMALSLVLRGRDRLAGE